MEVIVVLLDIFSGHILVIYSKLNFMFLLFELYIIALSWNELCDFIFVWLNHQFVTFCSYQCPSWSDRCRSGRRYSHRRKRKISRLHSSGIKATWLNFLVNTYFSWLQLWFNFSVVFDCSVVICFMWRHSWLNPLVVTCLQLKFGRHKHFLYLYFFKRWIFQILWLSFL